MILLYKEAQFTLVLFIKKIYTVKSPCKVNKTTWTREVFHAKYFIGQTLWSIASICCSTLLPFMRSWFYTGLKTLLSPIILSSHTTTHVSAFWNVWVLSSHTHPPMPVGWQKTRDQCAESRICQLDIEYVHALTKQCCKWSVYSAALLLFLH